MHEILEEPLLKHCWIVCEQVQVLWAIGKTPNFSISNCVCPKCLATIVQNLELGMHFSKLESVVGKTRKVFQENISKQFHEIWYQQQLLQHRILQLNIPLSLHPWMHLTSPVYFCKHRHFLRKCFPFSFSFRWECLLVWRAFLMMKGERY